MIQTLTVATSSAALSELERALTDRSRVRSPLAAHLSASIVDETGHEVKIEEMSDVYAALLFFGNLRQMEEIERETRVGVDLHNHDLAGIAAGGAYAAILSQAQKDMKVLGWNFRFKEAMEQFDYVNSITGVAPSQGIHNRVLSAIVDNARKIPIARFVANFERYESAYKATPPPEVLQKFYSELCSPINFADSFERVREQVEKRGIPPQLNGRDVPILDFVYLTIKGRGEEVPTEIFQIYKTAREQPGQFIDDLCNFMASRKSRGNTRTAAIMMHYVAAAKESRIRLPEEVAHSAIRALIEFAVNAGVEKPTFGSLSVAQGVEFVAGQIAGLDGYEVLEPALINFNRKADKGDYWGNDERKARTARILTDCARVLGVDASASRFAQYIPQLTA